ncbi:MAG: signal peptidase I [Planctomycetes bacterium]|nr:signal peptidase I [Planctomycetota bacterium]
MSDTNTNQSPGTAQSPAPSSPAEAAASSPGKAKEDKEKKEGHWLKENVEALIVAIMMALVIRYFSIEAFQIPTQSMFPTLYGENKGSNFGDRILVNKWIYEFRNPERWEVVVFKYPLNTQKNFIKRLVGLSGETIRITDGDVYSAEVPEGKRAEWEDFHVLRKPRFVRESSWLPDPVYQMDRDVTKSDTLLGDWMVVPSNQRKVGFTEETVDGERWIRAGWTEEFEGEMNADDEWFIEFTGYDLEKRREAENRRPDAALWSTRRFVNLQAPLSEGPGARWELSPDLRVETVYSLDEKPGKKPATLLCELEWIDDTKNVLRYEIGPDGKGSATLRMMEPLTEALETIYEGKIDLGKELPRVGRIAFFHVDQTFGLDLDEAPVTLSIQGESLEEIPYEAFSRSITQRLELRLGFKGPGISFSDLEIKRDIYYTTQARVLMGVDHDGFERETTLEGGDRYPANFVDFRIPKGQYLVLGDNSMASKDGRLWMEIELRTKDGDVFHMDGDPDSDDRAISDMEELIRNLGVERIQRRQIFQAGDEGVSIQPVLENFALESYDVVDTEGHLRNLRPEQIEAAIVRNAHFVRRDYFLGRALLVFWPMMSEKSSSTGVETEWFSRLKFIH